MAKIALVRVDNRLIHGQVATGFLGKIGADKIVVIDDKTATNEFARDVLALAVPSSVSHEVYTSKDAAEVWKDNQFGSGTIMIIAKDIPGIYASFKEGLVFDNLMIGGTKNAPNRVKIEGAISMDKTEADMLDELSEAGIDVIFQQTAQTRITPWADVRKKHSFV